MIKVPEADLMKIVLGTDDLVPPYRSLPPPHMDVIKAMALELLYVRKEEKAKARMYEDIAAQDQKTYDAVKANCLADGMVEVEPGHFVRPGEPWEDEHGGWHE